ncbi:hypothetical protein AVEN_164711-1 [Araneus ventricosus]|uniref:Integrase zinc-binding domain-containing protein n=1 Tax=Araneus ventricosus TaxID=182803 RepID=A0A4Y2HJT7_ARAVE|nr:hypothetical protein AVEN_164711-1 [Araneus ventricosus]
MVEIAVLALSLYSFKSRAAVLYKKWSKSAVLLDVTRKSQKAQLEDPAIRPILEKKLNSEDRPSWQEIAPESPATKRYWTLWDFLHLKDGVQYRKWEGDDGSFCRWQLILLKSRIQDVLRETHDSASGGHFGVMKSLSKIRERFYWDRLRTDVEKWCRDCHACGARKGPKTRTNGRTRTKYMRKYFCSQRQVEQNKKGINEKFYAFLNKKRRNVINTTAREDFNSLIANTTSS